MPRSILHKILKGVHNPGRALRYILTPRYRNTAVRLTSRFPVGTHVLSREWDLLILLDTCRVDALRSVADEYSFITDVDSMLSIGGSSPEWMAHTFDVSRKNSLQSTAYLTANAWAERVLDQRLDPKGQYSDFEILSRLNRCGTWDLIQPSDLGRIERIWKFVPEEERPTAYQEPHGLMPGGAPPRYVTERAISVARQYNHDRLILHYMQPHAPYMANADRTGRGLHQYEHDPFEYLQKGGLRDDVWNAYLDELRFVLDDLKILLQNVDAEKVVISADHGEAFGEFGIHNHHTGSFHPNIRVVPWVVTSGTDTGSYSPQIRPREQNDRDVAEELRALGYK